MKNSFNYSRILAILLIIAGVFLLIFQLIKQKIQAFQENNEPAPMDEETDEPDEPEQSHSKDSTIINHYKLIRETLPDDVNDTFAKIITAQAMHETGVFTSRLYQEQNNLFGMRHPVLRETKSLGSVRDYANFASLEDSVSDLLLYFNEFKYAKNYNTVDSYVKQLKAKGYFTAQYVPYFNAVRSHYNYLKSLIQ